MNTEKRRKILSIVVPLLFLMAGLFYWARFMGQTPTNIVPSTELLTSDLSSLRFNFEGHELRFPLTVREFKETTKWEIKDKGDPTDSDTHTLEYAFDNYTVTFLFTPTPNKLLLVKFECLDSFLQDE